MNAALSAAPPLPVGFGRWLRLSLVIHIVIICGVFFSPPLRQFFIYSIVPTRSSAEIPPISGVNSSSELREQLDRTLASVIKDPKDDELLHEVKKSAEALFLSAQDSEQKFYHAQIEQLAKKLGINTAEAEKLLPFKEKQLPEVDKLLQEIRRSTNEPATTLQTSVEAFSQASNQIAIEAEQKQQMALEVARGETPLRDVSITEQGADIRDSIRQMLQDAAANHSKDIRDLTGAMRSYYGAELAQGGAPRSLKAGMDDAAPGRVQVTQTGLIPPPLLDKKWLASVYVGRHITSFPAGRIGSNANFTRSGPLFLDSWYVLGPWALDNERDFFKSFPPEDKVDLDAEYIGKGGRKLRWQFIQSKEPLVDLPLQVPDSATYAFTTLDFAKEQEAWILCGADDRMKLWINGLPIFGSLASLKGWHIGNEGIRKVLFQAGRNDVLVRIDNLPGFTRFSVVLLPPDFENKNIVK